MIATLSVSLCDKGKLIHFGDDRADFVGFSGRLQNTQGAGTGRGNLFRRLVTFKGVNGLPLVDGSAVSDQPFGENTLVHRKAQLGNFYFHHCTSVTNNSDESTANRSF